MFAAESAVSTRMYQDKERWEEEQKQQGLKNPKGKLQIAANPGWLPISKDQHRAHEAPARLEAPNKPDPKDRVRQPAMDKGKQPATDKGKQPAKDQPRSDSPSSLLQQLANLDLEPDTKLPARPKLQAETSNRVLRNRLHKAAEPAKAPKSNPGKPKPGAKDDPNNYLRPEPSIPQYKPGNLKEGTRSPTPGISPPTDRESSSRVPPRPQNRESFDNYGLQKPNLPQGPLPNRKPIKGGPTGNEGTSLEAPADLKGRPGQKAPDTSSWKPYGSGGGSGGSGKKPEKPVGSKPSQLSLPTRPKQPPKGSNTGQSTNPGPASPEKQANSAALAAARIAFSGSSSSTPTKPGKKGRRDLAMSLLRKRLLRRSEFLMDLYEFDI